jgi:predicted nucleic acid-binding protein
MPVTHLLDTSVYSQPIRKSPVQPALDRWESVGDTAIVTSVICEAEVLYGIHHERRRNSQTKIHERYEALLKGKCDLLPVDQSVAAIYAEMRDDLQCRGKKVAHMDLLIAATAKANNLIVATLNVKDFAIMNGVIVEDWSIPPSS